MRTNSYYIKRRLKKEGWVLDRVTGSHHVFRNPKTGAIISLPHLEEDLGPASSTKSIRRWNWRGTESRMTHYIAIVGEDEGKAVGVWFPDLTGCVSAGDTLEEAMNNAAEALALWIDVANAQGRAIPPPRALCELKRDPEAAEDIARHMVALIEHRPLCLAA